MQIYDTVAVVTGAAGPIGRGVALELARRGAHGLALADPRKEVLDLAQEINSFSGDWICTAYQGDISRTQFRTRVFSETAERCGRINVCVPTFGCADPEISSVTPFQQTRTALDWAMELASHVRKSPGRWNKSTPTALIFFIQLAASERSPAMGRETEIEKQIRSEAAVLAAQAVELGIKYAVMLPTPGGEPQPPHRSFDSVSGSQGMHSDSVARAISFLIPALSE